MGRESSRKTYRRAVLPTAPRKRKVQPKQNQDAGVDVPGDVLRLAVEATPADFSPPTDVALQATNLHDQIRALDVLDNVSYELVGTLVRHVKQVQGRLEEFFAEPIKRAFEAHKAALAARDRAIGELHLEEAESIAKHKLSQYFESNPDAPRLDGISFPDDWKVEITDETLVPREYMKLDMQKIYGVAIAMKEATDIPGVKVTCRKKVSVRK